MLQEFKVLSRIRPRASPVEAIRKEHTHPTLSKQEILIYPNAFELMAYLQKQNLVFVIFMPDMSNYKLYREFINSVQHRLRNKAPSFRGALIEFDKVNKSQISKLGGTLSKKLPKFRLFYKGGQPAEFYGKHDLQKVLEWITSKIGLPGPFSKINNHN